MMPADRVQAEPLQLDAHARAALWPQVFSAIEEYAARVDTLPAAPRVDPETIRAALARLDFSQPLEPAAALQLAVDGLTRWQTHTPHPRYFGLFNPAPAAMGIAADALVAAFNPQLAAWGHNPFAVEVEQHLVRALGAKFGYDPAKTEGVFTSCGSEANHTALLVALTSAFPAFGGDGVRGLPAPPVFYASAEGHHSLHKAARACGLGTSAVREIPVDGNLRMRVAALEKQIATDRHEGRAPFLVVATAGTTSGGAIDPLAAIAEVAAREGLWLHVDAAWGGAAALVPEMRPLLAGIERADSITLDAHKWLSVPMGAGLHLNRHPGVLAKTFSMQAAYVPFEPHAGRVVDFYAHSITWSRRFTGLKLFLTLAVAGWEGYAAALRHMAAMGDLLRKELDAAGWEVVYPTPLPLACFVDRSNAQGRSAEYLERVGRHVVESGAAWISNTRVAGGTPVLRACITNFRTGPEDIRALIAALATAREEAAAVSA